MFGEWRKRNRDLLEYIKIDILLRSRRREALDTLFRRPEKKLNVASNDRRVPLKKADNAVRETGGICEDASLCNVGRDGYAKRSGGPKSALL